MSIEERAAQAVAMLDQIDTLSRVDQYLLLCRLVGTAPKLVQEALEDLRDIDEAIYGVLKAGM